MDQQKQDSRYIPTEIRRAVLIEAGHACVIPTCQFPATEFAHIIPFSEVKQHAVDNIFCLCPNHHTMYDVLKKIDRKAIRTYKLNLQFLNKRYTVYEMRILRLLSEKMAVVASGEIETMNLLKDGLIYNAKTFETQSINITDNSSGHIIFNDIFVQSFAAKLTEKGKEFIRHWRDEVTDLLNVI